MKRPLRRDLLIEKRIPEGFVPLGEIIVRSTGDVSDDLRCITTMLLIGNLKSIAREVNLSPTLLTVSRCSMVGIISSTIVSEM